MQSVRGKKSIDVKLKSGQSASSSIEGDLHSNPRLLLSNVYLPLEELWRHSGFLDM